MGRHGLGTVYFHKGRQCYCGELQLGRDESGKAIRWRCYAPTREEADSQLLKAIQEHRRGRPILLPKQTVGEYLTWWLEQCVKPPRREPSTYVSHERNVRLYLMPALGKIELAKLAPQQVQALVSSLLARGLSPRTVEHALAVLHSALHQAVRLELVGRNVADLVARPRADAPEKTPLDPEQARALVQAIRGNRLEALYLTTMALGLRQGEVLGLRWQDLDLGRGTLRVAVKLQRIAGEYSLRPPKTRKSRQTLPLPPFAIEALQTHRRRQEAEKVTAGERWENAWEQVFTTPLGRPISGSWLTHAFQRTLAAAGLPRVAFHDLRHTCATLLAIQGVPLAVAREVLRHAQIATTAEVYTHVPPPLTREAMDRMQELFAPDGKADGVSSAAGQPESSPASQDGQKRAVTVESGRPEATKRARH